MTADVVYADTGIGTNNVTRVYAESGNISISGNAAIVATTNPSADHFGLGPGLPAGNTIAAPNGTVTLSGSSVTANVTTTDVTATSTTGDVVLTGNDNSAINVTATSTTGGNVTVTETADVTGTLDGNSVIVAANSLDVDLGTRVASVIASTTDISAGFIDLAANSADLQVRATAPATQTVTVSNIGGNIATAGVFGSDINISAPNGNITRASASILANGPGSTVTLTAQDIMADMVGANLVANATGVAPASGNVVVTSVTPSLGVTGTSNGALT